MLPPLPWPQQRLHCLPLMLLALFVLSVMAPAYSNSLRIAPRHLDTRVALQKRATAGPLVAAAAGAAASATAPRPPTFLIAHRRCYSLGTTSARPASSLCAGGPVSEGGGEGTQLPTGPRVQAVLEQLQQLTLLEVSELVRQLERVFGVSAASALGAAAAATSTAAPAGGDSPGDSGVSEAAKAPEKTEFKVVMKAVPTASRISVIKTLRSVRSDLGLKEAKNFIDSLPKDVTESINKAEAQKIFDALKAAGAEVEMV